MDLSIRITHREGDVEQSIEIGHGANANAPVAGQLIELKAEAIAPPIAAALSLEWSGTLNNGERLTYADAEKACAALGDGWRLPTRVELESILDLSRHDPAIDTEKFPDTKSSYYWTSTPCAWAPAYAWVVGFDDGDVNLIHRDSGSACVRAVRSVPAGQ